MTGKRAAIGFSGNAYFHPFVWDAIHLFELDYDEQGRVLHAWELDNPGTPRLDFTWDGQRLLKVTGHDSAGAVVYSRALNYSGDRLTGEAISGPGGTSHREYKYDKQGRMVEAKLQRRPVAGRPVTQDLFRRGRQGEAMNMRVITWIVCSAVVVCGQSTSRLLSRCSRSCTSIC